MKLTILIICVIITHSKIPYTYGKELDLNILKNPELETKWQTMSSSGWLFEGEDLHRGVHFRDSELIVSPSVSILLITCSAHYPVYWDCDPKGTSYEAGTGSLPPIVVTTQRISQNFSDPHSYLYYTFLRLRSNDGKGITGNYTCKSANGGNQQINRFIFAEGRESILLLFSQNQRAQTRECVTEACRDRPSITAIADKNNQTIILPCSLRNPNSHVTLYKKNMTSISSAFEEVKLTNESITFDSKIGFILKVQELPSPYGIFKCALKLGPYSVESLIVDVSREVSPARTSSNDTLTGKARYYFDDTTTTKRIICCSSGTKPPKMYIRSCKTKIECEKIRRQLENFEHFDRKDDRAVNCRKSAIDPYAKSGVFRCFGDGVDIIREYYVPSKPAATTDTEISESDDYNYETTDSNNEDSYLPSGKNLSNIYYDDGIWQLPKELFISIGINNLTPNSSKNGDVYYNVYSNMSIMLQCYPSKYWFTYGIRWSTEWKNGTTLVHPDPHMHSAIVSTLAEVEISMKLNTVITSDVLSITCHAPVYNSDEWVEKSFRFNIRESIPPTIKGPIVEEFTWVEGGLGKYLVCETNGTSDPKATFAWMYPWTQHSYNYRYVTRTWTTITSNYKETLIENTSNKLSFSSVMKPMDGNYTCTISSLVGTVIKTFVVNVTDPMTTTTTTRSPLTIRWLLKNVTTTIITTTRSPPGPTEMPNSTEMATTGLILNDTDSVNISRTDSNLEIESSQANTILVTALIIMSLLLIGSGIAVGYLWRRTKRQERALDDSTNPDSSLTWNEMANTSKDSYEDLS